MMLMLSSGMKYEVKQPMSQIMGLICHGERVHMDNNDFGCFMVS